MPPFVQLPDCAVLVESENEDSIQFDARSSRFDVKCRGPMGNAGVAVHTERMIFKLDVSLVCRHARPILTYIILPNVSFLVWRDLPPCYSAAEIVPKKV